MCGRFAQSQTRKEYLAYLAKEAERDIAYDPDKRTQEMYDADVSPTLISKVTDAVKRADHGVAKPTTGCAVSHCLYGLYCCQSPSEWQRNQQSPLPGAGYQHRRPERITGYEVGRK